MAQILLLSTLTLFFVSIKEPLRYLNNPQQTLSKKKRKSQISNSPGSVGSSGGLYKLKTSETTAATSRMIRVTSCNASHTSVRNVLGGLGGMRLEPNTSRRCCRSAFEPLRPGTRTRFGVR